MRKPPPPSEETLDALRAESAVSSGTHVFHTSDDEVPFVPTGQLFIEYEPEASAEERQKVLDDNALLIVGAASTTCSAAARARCAPGSSLKTRRWTTSPGRPRPHFLLCEYKDGKMHVTPYGELKNGQLQPLKNVVDTKGKKVVFPLGISGG